MKSHLIQLLSFAATNASWTFIPLLAKEIGLSDVQVGIVVALYAFTLFISSYFFGRTSDKKGCRITFLRIGLLASCVAFLLQFFITDETSLFLFRSLAGFCSGIFPAALIAYVHETKKNLGEFSAFGSFGWFLGALLGGIIAIYFTMKGVFIFSSLCFFIAFLMSFKIDHVKIKPLQIPLFPKKLIKKNSSIYLTMFVRHIGASMVWTFWPLFLKFLGADLFWIGIISAINSLAQAFMMFTITDKVKPRLLITGGLIMSACALFLYSIVPNFWYILPIQLVLGSAWAFLYVGSLRYLTEKNAEKATVSAILDSTKSLSSIISPFLAIIVISFADYRTTALLGSFLGLSALIIFNFMENRIITRS